jgi:Holliday junction resolvasome RuvABC DNA-binding subunit
MLGFSKPAVSKAVQAVLKANPSAKVEQVIKSALQMM